MEYEVSFNNFNYNSIIKRLKIKEKRYMVFILLEFLIFY